MASPSVLPFCQPSTGDRERDLVLEVLAGDYLNEGEYTARFEVELVVTRMPVAILATVRLLDQDDFVDEAA